MAEDVRVGLKVELDQRQVEEFFQRAPRTIFNAQRSALRTTTTWTKKELQRRAVAATGLPARVFKVYRTRSYTDSKRGVVWLGFKPVAAAYVGRLRQEDFGASSGQYYWQGGFVAKMNSGHESIWKRKGRKRLMTKGRYSETKIKRQPIVEQVVALPQLADIAKEVADLGQAELQRRFIEKLEGKLGK